MTRRRPQPPALTLAIERNDWERASLLLLIALAEAVRRAPAATIDDLLAALDADGSDDTRGR